MTTNSAASDAASEPPAIRPQPLESVVKPPWMGPDGPDAPEATLPVAPPGWSRRRPDVFGVIEVGSGRARLDVFRRGSDGSFQIVWHDEEAITGGSQLAASAATTAPGPGANLLDERLVQTLRRFRRVCGRHHVTVGAVAHGSDALNNHPDTLPRLFRMTGVALRQVSDRETARLLCLGVLRGSDVGGKSLVIDVGPEATLVVLADGEEPVALWRLGVGANDGNAAGAGAADGGAGRSALRALRAQVRKSLRQTRLDAIRGVADRALMVRDRLEGGGASGVRAARVRTILEEIASYLRLGGIGAVDRGLREGILFDLCRLAARSDA